MTAVQKIRKTRRQAGRCIDCPLPAERFLRCLACRVRAAQRLRWTYHLRGSVRGAGTLAVPLTAGDAASCGTANAEGVLNARV